MKAVSAVTVLLALSCVAVPAAAAPLTLQFFGSVDLSRAGASASSTFEGAATWDTAASPVNQPPDFAVYLLDAMALTVNGTDVSASIRDGILEVIDTSNFGDGLILSFHFSPPLDLGRPDREVQSFHGIFRGPQTLFSGTGVPQDLAFLASVTSTDSVFVGGTGIPCDIDPDFCLEIVAIGTLMARLPDTEVPEPGSIFLLGSGIVGAVLRQRRRPTPPA